ncbi:YciC family protein [Buchnera aphidicola]|uniref:YciC family protein n=1 Tax=Buchnera aphidicola TaxID=9 RepID=UPI0031B6B96D
MCFLKNILVYETSDFLKRNFLNLLIISIFCSFLTIMIHFILGPNSYNLSRVYGTNFFDSFAIIKRTPYFTLHQQKILFNLSFIKMSSILINNTILCASIMYMFQYHNLEEIFDVIKILKKSFKFMPPLLLLMFVTASIIEIGFIFFTLSGIILSILLFISPIIFLVDNTSIYETIKKSLKISWKHISKIFFPIFTWLLCKLLLIIIFATFCFFSTYINFFILQIIINLLTITVYTYIFYFYIFLNQNKI